MRFKFKRPPADIVVLLLSCCLGLAGYICVDSKQYVPGYILFAASAVLFIPTRTYMTRARRAWLTATEVASYGAATLLSFYGMPNEGRIVAYVAASVSLYILFCDLRGGPPDDGSGLHVHLPFLKKKPAAALRTVR